jgi:hypothetical protein
MLFVLVLWLQVQAAEVQKPQDPVPPNLERIRRALEGPAIDVVKDSDLPVFRVYVREHPQPIQKLWTDDTLRPLYIRTRTPEYHHEFLESVTPEEFRAATLYPIGVDVLPLINAAIAAMRNAMRERAEAKAREMVRGELKLLLEARKQAGKDR